MKEIFDKSYNKKINIIRNLFSNGSISQIEAKTLLGLDDYNFALLFGRESDRLINGKKIC